MRFSKPSAHAFLILYFAMGSLFSSPKEDVKGRVRLARTCSVNEQRSSPSNEPKTNS